MQVIRRKDTKPKLAIRRLVHAAVLAAKDRNGAFAEKHDEDRH